MKEITTTLVIVFLLIFSIACEGTPDDPFKNEAKDCYIMAAGGAGGPDLPVVCSQPVKIYDVLNQPRERVESVLGHGYKAQKIGFYPQIKGWITYQGGGIIVFYDDKNISKMMRVTTNKVKHDEKSIKDFFSASSIESVRETFPISCSPYPYYLAYFDGLVHPVSISPVGSGGFHIIYQATGK